MSYDKFSAMAVRITNDIDNYQYKSGHPTHYDYCRGSIEQALRTVDKEAFERGARETFSSPTLSKFAYDRGIAESRTAALEEAAKVADDHALVKGAHIHKGFKFCVEEVAAEIRNLKGDLK